MAEDWWKGAVIYQIYPRSFKDTNGDGVGDLPGIISELPYIRDLGVDGIWLSPFFTSPMLDFGYDVADYRSVDPLFGSMDDFDRLLSTAHSLGLRIIIDQVYSHTSDRHAWFHQSRQRQNGFDDWYVWADPKPDGSPPNNWPSVFGGPAWSWDTGRRQYYLHNFLREQPDLNFHHPAVQDAILDTAQFWLDRGIDGFRLDVANYFFHDAQLRDNPVSVRPEKSRPYHFQDHRFNRSRPQALAFASRFRDLLDRYDGKMAVAEVFSDHPIERAIEYTDGPDRLHTAYSFSFLHANELSVSLIRSSLANWSSDKAWPSWSFSNHDVARVASRWAQGDTTPAFANLLNALLLTLRGTIFLYQGEELGLPQGRVPFNKLQDPEAIRFWPDNLGRDGGRTPMVWTDGEPYAGFSQAEPWLPIDAAHPSLAVSRQQADDQSPLHHTRALLRLRFEEAVLRTGSIQFYETAEPLLAFSRGEDLLCIFNLGSAQETLPSELASKVGKILHTSLDEGALAKAMLPPHSFIIARIA